MSIESSVGKLRNWLVTAALPFWSSVGFDSENGSFIERTDFDGVPLADAPRRAMVQARQIYVFAHAALLGWWPQGREIALAAAKNLIDVYHCPDGKSGWIFSATANGAIQDGRRDLYTHSFALFGLAWAYKLDPEPRFREIALATLLDLDQHLASPTGGYFTELPHNHSERRQSPHMHLFEAMLEWFEATGEAPFLARAAELRGMMGARFYQPGTGALAEYFDGSWAPIQGIAGRIWEPGHHFEWSWLLRRYSALIGRDGDTIAEALYAHAERYGFDAKNFVVDELLDDGTVHKASRRCWPHTEAIKANAAAYEAGDLRAASRAEAVIDRLMDTFLGRPIAGGWIDHVDPEGAPISSFIPASTLYHVFLTAAEADRVWGRGAQG
jgi:mannose-6-phosphate isomerase